MVLLEEGLMRFFWTRERTRRFLGLGYRHGENGKLQISIGEEGLWKGEMMMNVM